MLGENIITYQEFENELLSKIKSNSKDCSTIVDNNKKLVLMNLKDTEKPYRIEEFVKKLNSIIVNSKKFNNIEIVLTHELFTRVLDTFRNSDVLIQACKKENKEAIQWLLTMNINLSYQDENGMTALMHAASRPDLLFLAKELLDNGGKSIYLTDRNGNNALFYAVYNYDSLKVFLDSDIDINQKNNNGETVLIYSCKNRIPNAPNKIINKVKTDLRITDNEGRNAAMWLAASGYSSVLYHLTKNTDRFDVNYRSKKGETLLSILIEKFHELYRVETIKIPFREIIMYARCLMAAIDLGCDINAPIDEDGNTPLMFFLMTHDKNAVYYIVKNCKDVDLSIKNKYGVSASFLTAFIEEPNIYLKKLIMDNKTFDYSVFDDHQNNLLIHLIVREEKHLIYRVVSSLQSNEKVISRVNDKNENGIIIATKIGFVKYLNEIYIRYNDINQQDHLGNTALHYAIKINDKSSINLLRYYHADPNLKNIHGQSPFDLIKESGDEELMEIMKNPLSPYKFEKKENKKGKSFFFTKKKTTDEKVNDYVHDYQVKQYKQEYEYMKDRKHFRYTSGINQENMKSLLWIIYSKQEEVNDKRLISLTNPDDTSVIDDICNTFAPKTIEYFPGIYNNYDDLIFGQTRKFWQCPY